VFYLKFLVDRCAGRKLTDWLNSAGHDYIYAGSLGPDPGDQALLERAVSERRILITIDKDFGRLVYQGGEEHCGVVRLPDVRRNVRIDLMKIIIKRYASQLDKGAIITVRGDRIRISLP
jgi:predicted nuclease of predicted toxin-antitoxin system